MPDLLGVGAAWLEAQRRQHLTRPVLYRRGAAEVTVPATVGRTIFALAGAGGVLERVESRDYLIAASDLGTLGPPQRGDRISEERDGQRHTAEVLAPGREPPWRWSDPNRTCYRIHTKHLMTETVP
jgi:hypothetical protein